MIREFKEEVSKEELAGFPVERFEGDIFVVDTAEGVVKALEMLSGHRLVGFDTETRPTFKKGQHNRVALLQLSTDNSAFLFRLNRIGLPRELADYLADSRIVKAGVAISDDIKGLAEWKSFKPGGFVELQSVVKDYGIKSSGLKKLAAIILGFSISKRQQVTNWESDVLSDAQLVYAATDAWVCHKIYSELINGRGRGNGEG